MDAQELLEKYAQGIRNFGAENLRGVDLKGADLNGIDLRGSDLTGSVSRKCGPGGLGRETEKVGGIIVPVSFWEMSCLLS